MKGNLIQEEAIGRPNLLHEYVNGTNKLVSIEVPGKVVFYIIKKYGGYRLVTYLEEGDLPHEVFKTGIKKITYTKIEWCDLSNKYKIIIYGKTKR